MKCDPHHERCSELEAINAELLAALEGLYNSIDSCVELTPKVMARADAAIKRAKEE